MKYVMFTNVLQSGAKSVELYGWTFQASKDLAKQRLNHFIFFSTTELPQYKPKATRKNKEKNTF